MAIQGSVGVGGTNRSVDVKLIQAALNLVDSSNSAESPLVIDGIIGDRTNRAIKRFQEEALCAEDSYPLVAPHGRTLQSLRASIRKGLNINSLRAIMAHNSTNAIDSYYPLFSSHMGKYRVNNPLRTAHFLAQVGHESLSLRYTEEIASGHAYEGRIDLGNTQRGDGVRFKGRGLIQLTGRNNYEEYAKHAGLNLTKAGNENLIAMIPKYAVDVSLWFWDKRNLNTYADNDDLRAVTRRVNGGYNGLEDRRQYLNRAKFFLL